MITVESTDGAVLAVHELGGDGPPLLFAHATGFHGMVWRAMAAEFPDRRCLALDFRGYGDSTEQHGPLTWQGFGDDVLATVEALELDADGDLQAIGHSKGGAALLLAEIARPGTFGALCCFEPIVFPPLPPGVEPPDSFLADVTRRRRESFADHAEAIDRFSAKPPLGSLRSDVLADYVRFGFRPSRDGVTLKARREHEARTYETGSSHGAFARLGAVHCPVLVAAGGDGAPPAQAATAVAEALPAGRLHAFPELGHFGPLEDPTGVAAVFAAFLESTR